MAYQLPKLNYAYDALEPHFDKETMEIHHSRHHQAYVDNANAALEGLKELQDTPPCEVSRRLSEVPADKQTALRNNVGGHFNHTFFWQTLTPNSSELQGALKDAIEKDFGSYERFVELFEGAAKGRFGSGWAWLIVDEGTLKVTSTANQDNPLMGEAIAGVKGSPIITLDVWEHAYYLKYQNKRPDYIKAFWNLVDWDKANERYQNALNA